MRGTRLAIGILVSIVVFGGWLLVGQPGQFAPIEYEPLGLRTGDVIVVRGDSWRSRIVLALEAGSSQFSHIGLINAEGDRITVVHATPERGFDAKSGSVIEEPIEKFFSEGEYLLAAVYRPVRAGSDLRNAAARLASQTALRGIPFDHQFELSTPDKIYCTELVWRAYKNAGIDLLWHQNDSQQVILPSDVIGSPTLKQVAEFRSGF